MRTSVIVVEDFYADPHAVREFALSQKFYYPYQADADVRSGRAPFNWMSSWFRKADECPFKSSAALIERLEQITGDRIDPDHWNMDFPITDEGKADPDCVDVPHSCLWNCAFHFKPPNHQPPGEGVHNHVVDIWNSVGDDGWAGLVYLSPDAPLPGGLKLWRNRDPGRNRDWMTPRENWDLVDDLGNVFNRLLLCRGNIPHSGAPGWGTNPRNGRLYQTFFFQVLPMAAPVGIQPDLSRARDLAEPGLIA